MPRLQISVGGSSPDQAEGTSGRSLRPFQYVDKSSNRTVTLAYSTKNFLTLSVRTDGESFVPFVDAQVFAVNPSSNDDGVFILEVVNDAESPIEVNRALDNLRQNDRVIGVVPALLDGQGATTYYLPERVVVRFRGIADEEVQQIVSGLGSQIVRQVHPSGLYELEIPSTMSISETITSLNQYPSVVFAEPAYYGVNDSEVNVQVDGPSTGGETKPVENETSEPPNLHVPTNSCRPSQNNLPWNLDRVDAYSAWRTTRGSPDIVVAVIDGWPETDHEVLDGKFFVPNSPELVFSSNYLVSHSMNICSVVAGEGNGQTLGVAPGLSLLGLVVNLSSEDYASRSAAILEAARWAANRQIGTRRFQRLVISCSWKTAIDVASIRTAIEDAISAGCVVVCSAGNDNNAARHWPSDYSGHPGLLGDGVISVAGTDRTDRKYPKSSYSSFVDISAPAGDGDPFDEGDILCADRGNSYVYGHGTSLAVPHVAATIGLMLSMNPALSPSSIKELIRKSVDDIYNVNANYVNMMGAGRLNAAKAVRAVASLSQEQTDSDNIEDGTGEDRATEQQGRRLTIEVG